MHFEQAIFFDDVGALLKCLEVIVSDESARLLRVTNRYSQRYDAGLTAGYRDVSLSLRLETAAARQFQVDAHVCEVQLVLVPFAAIKVPCPHSAPKERGKCALKGFGFPTYTFEQALFSFTLLKVECA